MKVPSLALLALSLVFPAAAQKLDCKDPKDNLTMKRCGAQALDRSEKRLEKTYRSLLATYDRPPDSAPDEPEFRAEMKRRLQDSQTKWVAYRESTCGALEASYESGSGAGYALVMCKKALTDERNGSLRALFWNWFQKR